MAESGRGAGWKLKQKFAGAKSAVGQWDSTGTWRRTNAEEIPERIYASLGDKMIARGKRVGLWQSVNEGDPNTFPCTCEKESTNASQRRCFSCFSVKSVPGYLKFGHETIWMASAEYASMALTGCSIYTKFKPFPIMLDQGVTSGTVISTDKPFNNPAGIDYEVELNAFRRAIGATVSLDLSVNAGATWTSVVLTEAPTITPSAEGSGAYLGTIPGALMTGSGNVRTRITLTRVSASDASTSFEIVRLRRVKPEVVNPNVQRYRPDLKPGEILILRTWVREKTDVLAGQGRLIDHMADGSWTMPLNWFDITIPRDTPAARVSDQGAGPHPFYEYTDGVEERTRYSITEIDYENQIGIFTQQTFVDQREQAGSPYFNIY